ncbi:sensor histidine kinase [Halobacteriovorax sp. HLS]|uniref:sensor histidine kinase n=1 Tax=Halobacteriovorax sp. HLS TaxID=2234000 RepID=UPI000FD980FD|nr:HAMP domain-containing sensor histidine kinase [Halobacteriovorax sp. HLS]
MQKEKNYLDKLRLTHLAKNNINSMVGLTISTILIFIILLDHLPRTLGLSYLTISLAQSLGRLYYYANFLKKLKSVEEVNEKRTELIFAILSTLSALTYSCFSISFFSYLSQIHQLFLLVIATGMVAITFNSNASSSKVFVPYSIFTLLPFFIWYALQFTTPESYISVFIIIFCVIIIKSSKSVNHYIVTAFEARQNNEHLLLNLKKRKKALEDTNQSLKKHIDDNEKLKKKLIEQESLAAVSVLSSGLAHEIRNPLNIIINSSAILKEIIEELDTKKVNFEQDDNFDIEEAMQDAKTSIEYILAEGHKANTIVSQLISTSAGHKKSNSERFSINELIEEVALTIEIAMKSKFLEANASVSVSLSPLADEYHGHKSELGKVLYNTLYNSIESLQEKYENDPTHFSPVIKINSEIKDDSIEIELYDNGIGVKEENLSKVFTPFYTTKPTNKATGLGMSSSYEIINNLYKGSMKLESKQGQFAKVIITLPLESK